MFVSDFGPKFEFTRKVASSSACHIDLTVSSIVVLLFSPSSHLPAIETVRQRKKLKKRASYNAFSFFGCLDKTMVSD